MIDNTTESVGILGLGSRSTLFYLEQLNKQYNAIKGNYHTFPSITYSVDFNTINPFLPNNFNTLKPVVKKSVESLFNLNVQNCLIPNITLHETIDLLQFSKPIIHPLQLAIKHLHAQNTTNVIVFGSLHTMSPGYVSNFLKEENITTTFPLKEDQIAIDNYRKRIYSYTETEADAINYKALIKKYSKNNTVLISCTELSLWTPNLMSNKIVDMALLQINEAVKHTI